MKIDLLYIDECPNWEETLRLLRLALDRNGNESVPISAELISSENAADHRGFAGSPTILIDGIDPFPAVGRTPCAACRLYVTPDGIAGHPTQSQLEEAVTSQA